MPPTPHVGVNGPPWEQPPLRVSEEPECCLMAKDCSMLAGEMGQTWETWGWAPFLTGLQTPPEPEFPSFQGLEVTGKVLWCLLGAFALGEPCEGTGQGTSSFHQDLEGWEQGNPMLVGQ